MIWVTAEDVVAIHSRIIQVSGGIDGLRDRAGLEAAIAAPLQSFGGEDLFPTDIENRSYWVWVSVQSRIYRWQ